MSEETSWCALTGSSGLLGRFQSYYHSSVLHLGIRSQFVLGLTWMFHTENMMVLLVGGMNWCQTIGSRVLWSVLSVCVWVFFFLFFVFFFVLFCFCFCFIHHRWHLCFCCWQHWSGRLRGVGTFPAMASCHQGLPMASPPVKGLGQTENLA